MRYLFGDADPAIRRLEVVAAVFAEPSREFLKQADAPGVGLAVDLGCGAGFTTALVAETLRPRRLVGLDSSERLLGLARQRLGARATFHLHDVTAVPFPVGPADVLYCRLLLTHLRDPEGVLARWGTELAPGGLLLVDEVESIATEHPTLREYLGIVEALLAHQGTHLYVGPRLGRVASHGLAPRASRVHRWPVPTPRAAEMFQLNLAAWRETPFVRERWPAPTIDRLGRELEALAGSDEGAEVVWGLRQIIFTREQ